MLTAVQPLTDVQTWLRGSLLEILLIVSGAILLARAVRWVGETTTGRIDANAQESDALVRSEAAKHRHALTQVVTWTVVALIYVLGAVLVVQRMGVPLGGLVAPAAVAGVALGFGAQRLVQDVLAGFFVITEHQYGYGDVVRLAIPGTGTPVQGTVEDVTLRVTQLRTVNGEVVITPRWAGSARPPGRWPPSSSRPSRSTSLSARLRPPRVVVIPAQTTTPSPTPSPAHSRKATRTPEPSATTTSPSPSLTSSPTPTGSGTGTASTPVTPSPSPSRPPTTVSTAR